MTKPDKPAIITWNSKNKQILTDMWNADKTDAQISEHFNAGTYAIAKQRSVLGLIKHKMPKGIKRAKKTIKELFNKPFFAIYYKKDGQNHFSFIDSTNENLAKETAKNILYKQGINEITILQPVTKLVLETIKEIKL